MYGGIGVNTAMWNGLDMITEKAEKKSIQKITQLYLKPFQSSTTNREEINRGACSGKIFHTFWPQADIYSAIEKLASG